MTTPKLTFGELLVVKTDDGRPALLWAIDVEEYEYQEVVDQVRSGEVVICLDPEMDSNYVLVMSPRCIPGYIHYRHVSLDQDESAAG